MTDLEMRAQYGHDYFDRLCPDKKRFLNAKDVLDFDFLIKWITKYCPLCELHLSGGECLLRPDIEHQIQKLVNANIKTTIFTNGMLIAKRPKLTGMPLKWVIAHHLPNPIDKWLENVKLVGSRPIITTRLITCDKERDNKDKIAADYDGLNFYWSRGNGCKLGTNLVPNPDPDDVNNIASRTIHLIVPDGRVFPCNVHTRSPIGHIMTMEYYPERARKQDAHAKQCVIGQKCSAYQTARMVAALPLPK